jgi:hypothetical protein
MIVSAMMGCSKKTGTESVGSAAVPASGRSHSVIRTPYAFQTLEKVE